MVVMSLLQTILSVVDKVFPARPVWAHCDIPCGIYDPHNAQMAAHTVLRMVSLLNEIQPSSNEPPFDERKKIISQISRLTKVKEEHAEIVKHEIRILWGDYFKEEHLKEYPQLHELMWKTLKLASKARQEINLETAQELLANVQQIAEIFYKTKGVTPIRVKAVYPTEGELVFYK